MEQKEKSIQLAGNSARHKASGRKQPVFSFKNPLKNTSLAVNTMCEGTDGSRTCPIREHCLRFNAKPNMHYQAWFAYLPFKFESQQCDCFIQIEENQFNINKPFGWF